jgi:hypothetical protein
MQYYTAERIEYIERAFVPPELDRSGMICGDIGSHFQWSALRYPLTFMALLRVPPIPRN